MATRNIQFFVFLTPGHIVLHLLWLAREFCQPNIVFQIFYRRGHRGCHFWRGQNKNTIAGLVADYHHVSAGAAILFPEVVQTLNGHQG